MEDHDDIVDAVAAQYAGMIGRMTSDADATTTLRDAIATAYLQGVHGTLGRIGRLCAECEERAVTNPTDGHELEVAKAGYLEAVRDVRGTIAVLEDAVHAVIGMEAGDRS